MRGWCVHVLIQYPTARCGAVPAPCLRSFRGRAGPALGSFWPKGASVRDAWHKVEDTSLIRSEGSFITRHVDGWRMHAL